MMNTKTKKFHLLCSYKEIGRPVSDDELRDAFEGAVHEASYFEPEAGDNGEVDYLSYAEELGDYEIQVAERMLKRLSPILRTILCS